MAVMQRDANLGAHLARLAKLQGELALAEVRGLLGSAAATVAAGAISAIALVSALVVLVAGGLAPFFGGRWQHLVVAGGGVAIVAGLAMLWSVSRLRRLTLPREALRSVMENWEWLVAQVRSRLTLP
jgi:hypothetical protein